MVAFHMACCIIELAIEYRDKGDPKRQYKDVCKRDMKAVKMDYTNLESLGDNRAAWKQELPPSLKNGELALKETPVEKRKKRKESSLSNAHLTDDYVYLPGMQPPPQVTHRTEHPH